MKLPDFLEFEPFNQLRQQMKADLLQTSEFKQIMQTLSVVELEAMQNKGLEIDINQVEVLDDGTLKYKDRRILIYIRDINSYFNMPKFHFANCITYQNMKSNNRGDRYVASIKTNGYFDIIKITSYDETPITCELSVCKNCLLRINYNHYPRNKDEVFDSFSLEEYFEQYPTDFLKKPKYDSITAPINQYTHDWNDISKNRKEQNNFICDECNMDLSNHKKYLDTHHVNGLKNDNSKDNLKVLCIECHAKQPNHAHITVNCRYKQFLELKLNKRVLIKNL